MSELKYFFSTDGEVGTMPAVNDFVYLKSEADKVIGELKDKLRHYPMMVALLESDKTEIAELKAQKAQAEDDFAYWKAKAQRERHHKYKRCLAMALLSLEKREVYKAEYEEWCLKWYKRWLELAEKFKEAK